MQIGLGLDYGESGLLVRNLESRLASLGKSKKALPGTGHFTHSNKHVDAQSVLRQCQDLALSIADLYFRVGHSHPIRQAFLRFDTLDLSHSPFP